jgi:hypothetical protein
MFPIVVLEDVWWMNAGEGQMLMVAKVLGGDADAMATSRHAAPRCDMQELARAGGSVL